MKKILWILAMVGALLLIAGPVLADGDFYVVAGGGQPVGTKITSLPYPINNPGFYYLGSDLVLQSSTGGTGITINTDNVTLDLMGFKLSSTTWNNQGIVLNGARTDVEIRNGTMTMWGDCIYGSSSNINVRVINVRMQAFSSGAWIVGDAHLIKGCGVRYTINPIHIGSGTVSGCTIIGDGNTNWAIAIMNYGLAVGNYINTCVLGITSNGNVASSVIDNFIENCSACGISTIGTMRGNSVSNCATGIQCYNACSVVGNTVITSSGQTGIQISTTNPVLLSHNAVSGTGTHITGAGAATVNVNNAGF